MPRCRRPRETSASTRLPPCVVTRRSMLLLAPVVNPSPVPPGSTLELLFAASSCEEAERRALEAVVAASPATVRSVAREPPSTSYRPPSPARIRAFSPPDRSASGGWATDATAIAEPLTPVMRPACETPPQRSGLGDPCDMLALRVPPRAMARAFSVSTEEASPALTASPARPRRRVASTTGVVRPTVLFGDAAQRGQQAATGDGRQGVAHESRGWAPGFWAEDDGYAAGPDDDGA